MGNVVKQMIESYQEHPVFSEGKQKLLSLAYFVHLRNFADTV